MKLIKTRIQCLHKDRKASQVWDRRKILFPRCDDKRTSCYQPVVSLSSKLHKNCVEEELWTGYFRGEPCLIHAYFDRLCLALKLNQTSEEWTDRLLAVIDNEYDKVQQHAFCRDTNVHIKTKVLSVRRTGYLFERNCSSNVLDCEKRDKEKGRRNVSQTHVQVDRLLVNFYFLRETSSQKLREWMHYLVQFIHLPWYYTSEAVNNADFSTGQCLFSGIIKFACKIPVFFPNLISVSGVIFRCLQNFKIICTDRPCSPFTPRC